MSAGSDIDLEREYLAYRESVRAMLRKGFRGVPDHDEIYHEAWAEALELQARGEQIESLRGLIHVIAWRTARDRLRARRHVPVDPGSRLIAEHGDGAQPLDEQAAAEIDGNVVRQIVDSMDARQALAIKLRYQLHLDPPEIRRALGVSEVRLHRLFVRAHHHLEEALQAGNQETFVGELRRRQRSLLAACVAGIASERQRAKAAAMVRDDPVARATLAEIRAAAERIAALVPLPLLLEIDRPSGRIAQLKIGASDRFAALRDRLADLAARLTGHGTTAEHAGVGGAGLASGGMALKAALVCVAVGGSTVVCLQTGLLGLPTAKTARPAHSHPHHHRRARPQAPVRLPTRPAVVPAPAPAPAPVRHHAAVSRARRHVPRTVSAPAAPSPAPAGSTEFGPGSIGSTPRETQPAPAPASGGGEFLP